MINRISGGVCAAQGFTAGGVHCGIRKSRTKRDLSMIRSTVPAAAAAVYFALVAVFSRKDAAAAFSAIRRRRRPRAGAGICATDCGSAA